MVKNLWSAKWSKILNFIQHPYFDHTMISLYVLIAACLFCENFALPVMQVYHKYVFSSRMVSSARYSMLKTKATLFSTLTIVIYLVWKILDHSSTGHQVSK